MCEIAKGMKAKSTNTYYDGVIAAVDQYQTTGVICRKGTP
jgi:hypothetical protein